MMLLINKWKEMSKGHKTTVVFIIALLVFLCIYMGVSFKGSDKKTINSKNDENVMLNQKGNEDDERSTTDNGMTAYKDSESVQEVTVDGSGNWDEEETGSSDNSDINSSGGKKQDNEHAKDDESSDSESDDNQEDEQTKDDAPNDSANSDNQEDDAPNDSEENDQNDKEVSVMPNTVDEGKGVMVEYNWSRPH